MSKTVRILARSKKLQKSPVFVSPKLDTVRGVFIVGDKEYSAVIKNRDYVDQYVTNVEGADSAPIALQADTTFRFEHGQSFNLGDPVEKFLFDIISEATMGAGKVLAKNQKSVNPIYNRFYLEDLEEEANDHISMFELTLKASEHVKNMTATQKSDFALLLGKDVSSMSENGVDGFMKEQAVKNPKSILDIIDNDPDYEARIIVRKLVNAGKFTINSEGVYMMGNSKIGVNEEYAINYLTNPDNQQIAKQLLADIGVIKKRTRTTTKK